jgi:hypothetical protein
MRVEILTNIYKREMKAPVTSMVTSASVSLMERAIKEEFLIQKLSTLFTWLPGDFVFNGSWTTKRTF